MNTPLRRNRFRRDLSRLPARNRLPPDPQIIIASPHWVDVWFPRCGHVFQFILTLITLGSLYFTVLPLYQKALLDEAIAKKEIDLKAATIMLEKKYIVLRAFSVKEFIFTAGRDCMGLGTRPETSKTKTFADREYEIDIDQCLTRVEVQPAALTELRPDDRVFFRAALQAIGKRLAVAKKDSLAKYQEALTLPETHLFVFPPDSFSVRMLEISERQYGLAAMQKERWNTGIRIERQRISEKYVDLVRENITNLKQLKWPVQQ
jgi:hypothetical protein